MRKEIVAVSFVFLILMMANSALATDPLIQATFSTNPVTVSPGNDGYIQMTLKNAGTTASDRITIPYVSYDSDIIPSGNWVGELSPLGGGDSLTYLFKFKISDRASLGLHTITFYINYGIDSTTRTITSNAIVNVQSASTLELSSIDPSSLRPGEKTNMVFTITNGGNSPFNNVIFTWTSSSNVVLPLGLGNRIVIPMIGANSQYNVSSKVFVSPSATPGVYPLSISIQYSDRSGTNQNVSSIAGIEIGGGTDFDVSLQESTTSSISLSVANIGVNPATSVEVSIPTQDRFVVTGATSVFLGDLNSGEYTIATFQLALRNATQRTSTRTNVSETGTITGENLLTVEISYTDTSGFRQVIQKEVSVASLSATQFSASTGQRSGFGIWLYVGIGAVVIIAAVVIYFKFFRRKKK